jgi:hypothetical protein
MQQYGDHRKALGLRGTSHVAVLKAIKDQRLTPPAVERQCRSWIINAELADAAGCRPRPFVPGFDD